MKSTKGFTLIELLVVISIIALLSSVVLSSLGAARSKGADNAVKAAMRQTRTQAQLYRDGVPNFSGSATLPSAAPSCTSGLFNDARMVLIKSNIISNAASGATLTCAWDQPTAQKWAISVSALKGGGSWCIDNSTGAFKAGTAITAAGATQGTCP